MWPNAKGLGGGPLARVIQLMSAGPFARPPVTRSEAVATLPGACASEGGLSGPALISLIARAVPSPGRWALWGAACLWVAGCSGGIQKVIRPPAQQLELTTAFVYPFGFRWEEPVYRRFELSQRLTEEAVRQTGEHFAFFGPSEFKVMRAEDNGAWVASTALPLLIGSGKRADQGVIIRPWAERRKNASVQESFDKKGKSTGMASLEETIYLGHVDVIHPSTGQVLIEVSSEVKVDPFSAEDPEDVSDPARPLTRLMGRLMHEAVTALAGQAMKRPVRPELGLTVALTPKATLSYVEDGKPATSVELAARDDVAQEIFVQDRAKFLAPFLSEAELPRVAKMPVGTYVVAAPAGAKVKPGDLLLTVDGEPALPQMLGRLRFSEVPAQVRVRKSSGEETEVLLP